MQPGKIIQHPLPETVHIDAVMVENPVEIATPFLEKLQHHMFHGDFIMPAGGGKGRAGLEGPDAVAVQSFKQGLDVSVIHSILIWWFADAR